MRPGGCAGSFKTGEFSIVQASNGPPSSAPSPPLCFCFPIHLFSCITHVVTRHLAFPCGRAEVPGPLETPQSPSDAVGGAGEAAACLRRLIESYSGVQVPGHGGHPFAQPLRLFPVPRIHLALPRVISHSEFHLGENTNV